MNDRLLLELLQNQHTIHTLYDQFHQGFYTQTCSGCLLLLAFRRNSLRRFIIDRLSTLLFIRQSLTNRKVVRQQRRRQQISRNHRLTTHTTKTMKIKTKQHCIRHSRTMKLRAPVLSMKAFVIQQK